MRTICCFLESRATYGYARNVMREMQMRPGLKIRTIVTGAHLVAEAGNSIELIRQDGFPVDCQVPMHAAEDTAGAWPRALGGAISGYAQAIEKLEPDIVLLFGDRIETFGCCLTCAYMRVPSAHVQAGDKSGHIDDAARMAMAKLSHIHLSSCEDSAERVRKLGEQKFRIFNVGAPQLDDMVGRTFPSGVMRLEGAEIDLDAPYLLFVMHPVLAEKEEAFEQVSQALQASLDSGLRVVCIYPNTDAGYQKVLNAFEKFQSHDQLILASNLERSDYLRLMAHCSVLVGNSSSGILEAPTFQIPVINIGNRQRGRPQAKNILNCGYGREEIYDTLQKVMKDADFQEKCRTAVNPYGDGQSSVRICDLLESIQIDQPLLDKLTVY